jgi:O-phosphoseryl-tRNA(Cys) synthetase
MRTAEQRIAKYNARMVSSLLDPVRTAVTADAQTNFAAYATEFTPKQVKLREWLNTKGIDPAYFGPYEAYHGEIFHLWKTTAGASLIKAAGAVVGRWAHASRLGIGAAADLKAIALDIYNIIVP